MLAGLAEETSTGSIGEVVDMEALKGFRDRLQEIDKELDEATSFNDPARHEKLGDERLAILDQIKSVQGPGGRVCQMFDAERSRKTVCKAISRSIEAIERESTPNWDCIATSPLISVSRSATAPTSSLTGCFNVDMKKRIDRRH